MASAGKDSELSRGHRYQATIGFWDCADQIEDWAGRGYSNVLWYLVSDSQSLRRVSPLFSEPTVSILALTALRPRLKRPHTLKHARSVW